MTSLNLSISVAQLTNLNSRVENHGDEKKLGIDLNFKFNTTVNILENILDIPAGSLLDHLYEKKRKLLSNEFGMMNIETVYENHIVRLKGLNKVFIAGDCKIKKIKAKLLNEGLAEISLQVQFTLHDLDKMGELVWYQVDGSAELEIEAMQKELFDGDSADAKPKKGKGEKVTSIRQPDDQEAIEAKEATEKNVGRSWPDIIDGRA